MATNIDLMLPHNSLNLCYFKNVTYRLPWIGGVILQRVRMVNQGVELFQTTPWFSGKVLLKKVSTLDERL